MVSGVLDGRWSEWFEGVTVSSHASGETMLSGPVADQTALLLPKVRDLGLPLLVGRHLTATYMGRRYAHY